MFDDRYASDQLVGKQVPFYFRRALAEVHINKSPDVISAQLICIHTSWRARDAFPLRLASINCLIVVRQTAQARSGRLPEQQDSTLSPGWVTGPSVASAVMPAAHLPQQSAPQVTHEFNTGGKPTVKWWNCETRIYCCIRWRIILLDKRVIRCTVFHKWNALKSAFWDMFR